MKRISLQFSALLATLFLFAFSCQDHVVPDEPDVQLATIKSYNVAGINPATINMEILNVGNVPIEEYGIVYSSRNDRFNEPINSNPTILDSKIASSGPKAVGFHVVVVDFQSSNFADVFSRAYLKHTNGAVVYGDIQYYVK